MGGNESYTLLYIRMPSIWQAVVRGRVKNTNYYYLIGVAPTQMHFRIPRDYSMQKSK